jgi:PAS domain S-box-containing protein
VSSVPDIVNSQSLRDLEASIGELQIVTDAVPVLVSYVDADERYRFLNVAYERWFGTSRNDMLGRTVCEVIGDEAYAQVRGHLQSALSGAPTKFDALVPYALGGTRWVEGTYVPDLAADGRVRGCVALITDISERRSFEVVKEGVARRAELLVRITGAIADAVTTEEVVEAVVDQVAAALGASSAGLWLLADDGTCVTLARAVGYSDAVLRRLATLPLALEPSMPLLDAIKSCAPVFSESQADLLARYPHLTELATPGRSYGIASLPLVVQDEVLGSLNLTFEGEPALEGEQRGFLQLVARYAGQALGRLRLLARERDARARAELLYGLADAVISAECVEQVFEPALDAIASAVGAPRAAILACDEQGTMRFRAWRGLSEEYRKAVDGHSPWPAHAVDPEPLLIADVEREPAMVSYLPLFRREGIAAVGFIPLLSRGRLIGKFMIYYGQPRELASHEVEITRAIANHIAAALTRFASFAELQRTVRFNELFTGMLGHDLRNPLSAMIVSAQAMMLRPEAEKVVRPLSRILASGDRMARMIDQLLDFTRVRVGQGIPIDPTPLDLVPLVQQVIDELDTNPDWTLRLDHVGRSEGTWDADRLGQVFSNLVANAMQHGEAAHGVTVRIDGTREDHVEVEVHNMGAMLPADVALLFEPMAVGARRRDRSRGLGLGLYITREILKAHGGTIVVRSSASHGTAFVVTLPRAPAQE